MTRELLLLRHGKSDWTSAARGDFDRPLAKRGRKAVKRMARWVRVQGLAPDVIVSSPALRARETALRFCRFAALADSRVRWDDAVYGADLETLLAVLATAHAGVGRMMLVGHNPGFEELLGFLAGDGVEAGTRGRMPTAALACLAMPDVWTDLARGCARLVCLIRPRELTA